MNISSLEPFYFTPVLSPVIQRRIVVTLATFVLKEVKFHCIKKNKRIIKQTEVETA